VATAEQLKALIRSHSASNEEQFRTVALQIAAHTAKLGNIRLADELRALIDECRRRETSTGTARSVPIARPSGELAGLVTASYPNTRLSDMVLPERVHRQIQEIVHQQRQRDRLRSHGLAPRRKLLLVGPPGCGKTMTAAALAGECQLPLMFVQLHSLITKYMGETAAKLHVVFDAMAETRGVYLFDEFDAIGAARTTGNDVGESRAPGTSAGAPTIDTPLMGCGLTSSDHSRICPRSRSESREPNGTTPRTRNRDLRHREILEIGSWATTAEPMGRSILIGGKVLPQNLQRAV
jgi:SpoVK/Ycf46/Vps4 family AAA+-type ATPase